MKKKTSLTLFVLFLLALSNGCTLNFKATDLELETKPPQTTIGNNTEKEQAYELVAIDLLKKQP